MYFLTRADLLDKITEQDILDITNENDSLLDTAELKAMAEIDAYLRTTFDMPKSWSKKNAARNPLLIQYASVVMIYHLNARIAPANVPQSRLIDYKNVLDSLKMISAGDLFIDLVQRKTEPDAEDVSSSRTMKFKSSPFQNFGLYKIIQ